MYYYGRLRDLREDTNTRSTVNTVWRSNMKIVRKLIAALMVLGAVAALTVGVLLKPGQKGAPKE